MTRFHRRAKFNRGSLAIFFASENAHLGASKTLSRAIFPVLAKIAAATAENRAILVHSGYQLLESLRDCQCRQAFLGTVLHECRELCQHLASSGLAFSNECTHLQEQPHMASAGALSLRPESPPQVQKYPPQNTAFTRTSSRSLRELLCLLACDTS